MLYKTFVSKNSYQIYKANRVFYEERAARRDINLYRKASVIGLVVYTLKDYRGDTVPNNFFPVNFDQKVPKK